MQHNWEEYFQQKTDREIREVVDLLKEKGMVTDECGTFMSKIMMKEAKHYLIPVLQKHGCRTSLDIIGKYYSSHGEVMAVYDSDRFKDHRDVLKKIDNHVERMKDRYNF